MEPMEVAIEPTMEAASRYQGFGNGGGCCCCMVLRQTSNVSPTQVIACGKFFVRIFGACEIRCIWGGSK